MESSTSAPRTRTRTQSALKWMANERAAIAGELEALRKALSAMQGREAKLAAQLAALDTSLVRFDESLDPSQIRAVSVWTEKNGGRGRKEAYFLAMLTEAGDAGLTAPLIQSLWANEIGDGSALAPELRDQIRRNQTIPTLKRLQAKGLAVCDPTPIGPNKTLIWRVVPQAAKKALPA